VSHSPEYWRGVTAAYDALYEGKEIPREPYHDKRSDYERGVLAQIDRWPVKILVPAEMEPRPTNFACGVLSGLAVTLLLAGILAPVPWAFGLWTGAVICGIGAGRNVR